MYGLGPTVTEMLIPHAAEQFYGLDCMWYMWPAATPWRDDRLKHCYLITTQEAMTNWATGHPCKTGRQRWSGRWQFLTSISYRVPGRSQGILKLRLAVIKPGLSGHTHGHQDASTELSHCRKQLGYFRNGQKASVSEGLVETSWGWRGSQESLQASLVVLQTWISFKMWWMSL